MTTSLIQQPPLPGLDLPERQLEPMEMIQIAFRAAVQQGSAMEVVNTILEQQRWMIQHKEEELFNTALKRIQRQLKSIPKRGWNDSTKSNFALAQDVDDAIQHLLDAEGMTLSFRPAATDRQDEVLIIGTLALGAFSKEYPLPMPADGKGPQGGGVMSRTHATGSAITYGKRYLKDMIFDLRFDDPKYKRLEDDGNAAGTVRPMDPDELQDCLDVIKNAPNPAKYEEMFRAAHKAAKDDLQAHLEIDMFSIKEAPTPDIEKAIFKIIFAKRRDEGNDRALKAVNDAHNAAKSAFLKGGAA